MSITNCQLSASGAGPCRGRLVDFLERMHAPRVAEAMIVGSGPTDFDYDELERWHGPIFFINRMHVLSELCPSQQQYFVTHHISEYRKVRPTTIFLERMWYEDGPDYAGGMAANRWPVGPFILCEAQAHDEVITKQFLDERYFLQRRALVGAYNRTLAGFGSATTAIHLAWYGGCQRIIMVGCDPDRAGHAYDARVAPGGMLFSPEKVKQNNRDLPGLLGLEVEYR